MIVALRLLFFALMVAGIICFAMYVLSGDVGWRHRGLKIVRWGVFGALGFFAVLILDRLVRLL